MLDDWTRKWIADPDGGGRFSRQRDLIIDHDDSCGSLDHVWLPRKAGVTCLTDITECDTCDIAFFWEGIVDLFDDCPDSAYFFCRCCAEKVMACPCGSDCVRDPNSQNV